MSGRRMRTLLSVAFLSAAWAILAAFPARAQTTTAVEYRHSAWGYYFVTAYPDEVAMLDGGAFGGVWQRTGQTFSVWTTPAADLAETCRFFSVSFAPVSTHFYTPFATECTSLRSNRDWSFEAIAFHLRMIDGNGGCPAGTTVLYRLYNNGGGGAPNHRYTTSPAIFDQMRAAGWSPEGHGVTYAFACAAAAAGSTHPAAGLWSGTTDTGETVRAVVLDDGTYYVHHVPPGVNLDGGVVQGTATAAGGTLASANGRHYPIIGVPRHGTNGRALATTVSGAYASQTSLQLTMTYASTTYTVAASYDPRSVQVPSLAAVAGRYAGKTGHVAGGSYAVVDIDASGNVSGSNDSCTFTGALRPRTAINAFDLSIVGRGCIIATGNGVAFYDDATRQLYGFVPFEGRTDLFFVLGTKQ